MRFLQRTLATLVTISVVVGFILQAVPVYAATLSASYAAMIDGDTGRLLYGKNEDSPASMASTTKIMTLVIALEICKSDYIATVSPYAASMPDVQLNAYAGEKFHMQDLYYSLMLESHNDSAVIIAENAAYYYLCSNPALWSDLQSNADFIENLDYDSSFISELSYEDSHVLVDIFIGLMNEKCRVLGLSDTLFITPNGLDAENESGSHHTTAYELAVIMSNCIQNDEFLKITGTESASITDTQGKRTYSLTNKNTLLDVESGLISGKTGFTSKAGYCYVCAYRDSERTLCIALLSCGWPPNKSYKWSDSRYLIALGSKYSKQRIPEASFCFYVPVDGDDDAACILSTDIGLDYLMCESDTFSIDAVIPDYVDKSADENTLYGHIDIFINDTFVLSLSLDTEIVRVSPS